MGVVRVLLFLQTDGMEVESQNDWNPKIHFV